MNPNQRRRLEKLEAEAAARRLREQAGGMFDVQEWTRLHTEFLAGGPYPADPPCPPGEDPVQWGRIRRSLRIRERRRLELFGHAESAAAIPIEPAPTADELSTADGFVEAFHQAALRTLYEKDGTDRPFAEWLVEESYLEPAADAEDDAAADDASPAADADGSGEPSAGDGQVADDNWN